MKEDWKILRSTEGDREDTQVSTSQIFTKLSCTRAKGCGLHSAAESTETSIPMSLSIQSVCRHRVSKWAWWPRHMVLFPWDSLGHQCQGWYVLLHVLLQNSWKLIICTLIIPPSLGLWCSLSQLQLLRRLLSDHCLTLMDPLGGRHDGYDDSYLQVQATILKRLSSKWP